MRQISSAIHRLRAACDSNAVASDLVADLREVLDHLDPENGGEMLTPRQHEIAILVARGCTNNEIAAMLGISANAVKKHISRVLVRLDVSNRTELAAMAGRWSSRSEIDAGAVKAA